MSSTGSVNRLRILASTIATTRPTTTPPPAARRKSRLTCTNVGAISAAAIAVRRQTRAVASFSRLSPSRIVTTRRGRPTFLAIAVAATASGGATTAPIANAAHSGSGSCPSASAIAPSSQYATSPTPTAVKATSPTDSVPIDRRCLEKSTRLVLIAAEYSSGGRKPTRTTSCDSSTRGTNGRYDAATPITTSSRGADTPSRRASAAPVATTATRATISIAISTRTVCQAGPRRARHRTGVVDNSLASRRSNGPECRLACPHRNTVPDGGYMRRRTAARLATVLALLAAAWLPASRRPRPSPPRTPAWPAFLSPVATTPVRICYSLFQPAGASSTRTVPLIFHSHGWGGSRTKDAAAFKSWLDAGYGVLSFDQRSFGECDRCRARDEPGSRRPRRDQAGRLGRRRSTGSTKQRPGDPLIGAIGGSYGGGLPVRRRVHRAARQGPDPLRRAGARDHLVGPQGEPRAGRGGPDDVAVDPVRRRWTRICRRRCQAAFVALITTGQWPTGQAGRDLDAFFAKNGPAWHVRHGRKLDIPVLIGQGLSDNLFNLNQGLKNFDLALTRARSLQVAPGRLQRRPHSAERCSARLRDARRPVLDRARQPVLRRVRAAVHGAQPEGRADRPAPASGSYHLATADGRCLTQRQPDAGHSSTGWAGSAPWCRSRRQLAKGPITVTGVPRLKARVSSLLPDARRLLRAERRHDAARREDHPEQHDAAARTARRPWREADDRPARASPSTYRPGSRSSSPSHRSPTCSPARTAGSRTHSGWTT